MKQILCFGDSNTYGLIPGTTDRYPWGVRWTSIVSDKLDYKKYRIIEEGLCGRTTIFEDRVRPGRKGIQSLPVILETHNPVDLVIVMLGTNDCKEYYQASAKRIGEGIEKVLDQINRIVPQSKVLLISPIHLGNKVWKDGYDLDFSKISVEVSRELDDIYRKIAEIRNIYFLAASEYVKCSEVDQEHLDDKNHEILAKVIYDFLVSEFGITEV